MVYFHNNDLYVVPTIVIRSEWVMVTWKWMITKNHKGKHKDGEV